MGSPATLDEQHPIDPAIRARILESLTELEREQGVRVLFACESGSRGWGFASPDSDYDVRFLYVHPLPWYLRVQAARDVIELPISKTYDVSGWELRKGLGLLARGNTTLIEWIDSPVIYRADGDFLAALRAEARRVHRPERAFHHYLHMARGNYRAYLTGTEIRLKKYLYVLRPLLAAEWVASGRGCAPMRFQSLVDELVTDGELKSEIGELIAAKRRAGEAHAGAPWPLIQAFIEDELSRFERTAPPVAEEIDLSGLDRLLFETVTASKAQ